MIYPTHEYKRPAKPNPKLWREKFHGLVKIVEKEWRKGCEAKLEPFIEGFTFEEDESLRRSYLILPDEQMAWQLEEVKKKGWKVIIYNSRSDFSNLFRVLGY